MPVDRYYVNDALAELAQELGVVLPDEVLNELTHRVASVLDNPAGDPGQEIVWRVTAGFVEDLVDRKVTEVELFDVTQAISRSSVPATVIELITQTIPPKED